MSRKLFRNLDHVIDQLGDRAREDVERAILREIFEKSQFNVPVLTGQLRDSGDVRGRSVVYQADYANKVHEDPNGRGYKFLQRAIDETDAMQIAEDMFRDRIDFL